MVISSNIIVLRHMSKALKPNCSGASDKQRAPSYCPQLLPPALLSFVCACESHRRVSWICKGWNALCLLIACYVAAYQTECPWWSLSTTERANNRHMSARPRPWINGRRWHVQMRPTNPIHSYVARYAEGLDALCYHTLLPWPSIKSSICTIVALL